MINGSFPVVMKIMRENLPHSLREISKLLKDSLRHSTIKKATHKPYRYSQVKKQSSGRRPRSLQGME